MYLCYVFVYLLSSALVSSAVWTCALEITLAWIGIGLENYNVIVSNIAPNRKTQYRFNKKFTDYQIWDSAPFRSLVYKPGQ